LKSNLLYEATRTQEPIRNAQRQAKCGYRYVSQKARITACLIDPREKVRCRLRGLVVNFSAAESAYIRRRVDRLLAVGAIENVEIL
jgi:hypothetical protein